MHPRVAVAAFALAFLILALAPRSAAVRVKGIGNNFQGKTGAQWQGRRVYQIVTDRFAGTNAACNPGDDVYCGGTFNGITQQLDYIKGMGFNAIWISPVVVNTHLGYHGYWAARFDAVNPHFGTEADLLAMVNAAHSKGIWVMIDVVANHVGPVGNNFTGIFPFNESSHYHRECQVTEYQCNSNMVHKCRLADLPDLNQTVPFVKQQLIIYVQWLLNTFGFDGIRADTVMYIENSFWSDLSNAVNTYIVGEVWSDFNCNLEYAKHGVDATLNYPLFYTLRSVFQDANSMRNLGNYWRQQATLPQPNWEGNFIDNQDNSRFLNTSNNDANYKSAIAHMFFTNGVPIIYYGTEQGFSGGISGNYCREPLWPTKYNTQTDMYWFLSQLNKLYDLVSPQQEQVEERWQDDTFYAFIRGPMMVATTNDLSDQTRTIPNLPFANMTVVNWLNPSQTWQGSDTMTITIPANQSPLILVGYASSQP